MKMMRGLTAGLFLSGLASCGPPLDEPDLANFPPSSGTYRGSLLWDQWVYRGSNHQGHHFTFNRSEGNSLRRKEVIFSRISLKVDSPFPLTKNRTFWKSARSYCDGENRMAGFTTHPTITHRIAEARRTGNILN